jgi:hypothetical protein
MLASHSLAVAILLLHPAAVQTGGTPSSWLIDGTVYLTHAARTADHAVLQTGDGEYRFEVSPGDQWWKDAEKKRDKERAELKSNSSVDFDVDYRVSYEMRVDTPLPVDQPIIAGQWHATEDAGDRHTSPPLSIELKGDDLVAVTRSVAAKTHTTAPPGVERYRMEQVSSGRWYRIDYDIRFSPTAGKLALWIDGRDVYAGSIPIGYNDDRGPYFKFGIYRPKANTRAVIRFRNLSIRPIQKLLTTLP